MVLLVDPYMFQFFILCLVFKQQTFFYLFFLFCYFLFLYFPGFLLYPDEQNNLLSGLLCPWRAVEECTLD